MPPSGGWGHQGACRGQGGAVDTRDGYQRGEKRSGAVIHLSCWALSGASVHSRGHPTPGLAAFLGEQSREEPPPGRPVPAQESPPAPPAIAQMPVLLLREKGPYCLGREPNIAFISPTTIGAYFQNN